MSPDEAKYCLLDPKTRNVQDITVDDEKLVEDLLSTFMDNAVEPRRKYLLEHIDETKNIE